MTMHSPERLAVKTAWKCLVGQLGGVEATGAATRRSISLISDYGNAAARFFPPADVIIDAEKIAGDPLVTAALARSAGFELVPVLSLARGMLAAALAEIGRDVGRLFADSAEALQRSGVSDAERAKLIEDLDNVCRAASNARAVLMAEAHRED